MKENNFGRNRLAVAVSMVLSASALPQVGFAQEQFDALEEVVVTGIRGSLRQSMDLKRNSDGVVDGISAEDIGKFPDTNLAESLQRITGVSIERSNGEGSKITVRGLGPEHNLVMLNGRQLANPTGGRSFDFQNVASEMVSSVEILKTGSATLPTGGLGSTVNMTSNRPLENASRHATFSAKMVNDTSTQNGDMTPEFSGLYSDTFADGKIGVSISGAIQERESGSAQGVVGTGWRSFAGTADNTNSWGGVPQDNQVNRPGADDVYSVPQTTIYKFEEQQRKRTNGQLVLQWAPNDSMTSTLDVNHYQNDIAIQHNEISAWFNFVPSENVWTDGPAATPLIYSESNFDSNGVATTADLSMAARNSAETYEGDSIGYNFEWDVNDRLNLQLDLHKSDAERRPDSVYGSSNTLSTAAMIRHKTTTDFTGDFPGLAVVTPDGQSGNSVSPSDMIITGSVFGNSRDFSEVEQYQFKGNFELNESSNIDFGIALTEYTNHSQEINVQRNDWGGVGRVGDFVSAEELAAIFPAVSIQDKIDGSVGGDAGELQDVLFAFDFETVRALGEQMDPYDAAADGSTVGDCGTMFCPSTQYDAATDRLTTEETSSVYFQYNLESDLASMQYSLHAGLRYETTDVFSKSAVNTYTEAKWIANTELALTQAPDREFLSETGDYDYLLPNLNFNLYITDDVIARAAYSQTIGRPHFDDIKGGAVVAALANQSGGSASSGNPSLLPLESENFDLSVEWYYGDSSYASVGLFRKEVANWISTAQTQTSLFGISTPIGGPRYDAAVAAGNTSDSDIRDYIIANNPNDPYIDGTAIIGNPTEDDLMVFKVDIPGNSDIDETIDGAEFAVQHMFGETGFGVVANYTIVDSGATYDDTNLEQQFALEGLSDSANLAAIYDNHGIQARIAYNWRDQFLLKRGDDTGVAPHYIEPYKQVDMSVSYETPFVEGLQVYLEGLNVTDQGNREVGRASQQVYAAYQTGARWQMGARYSF